MRHSDSAAASESPSRRQPSRVDRLPPRIVFFDPLCSFCARSIDWIVARDTQKRFHFAPLQGETAALLGAAHPDALPTDLSTLVYVENRGEATSITLRSQAVLRILEELGELSALQRGLRVLPRWLTDALYRAFAAIRYRAFGRLEACRNPAREDRERYLA